jgi:hypothetical protein
MALKFWTNQTVQVQSAIGAAQTITSISKASPGVVATSGTLPSNGQYVLLEVTGMNQVNRRIFKVAGAASGEFDIGVDIPGGHVWPGLQLPARHSVQRR